MPQPTQLRLFTRKPSCQFFLGTHLTGWLRHTEVPLFVSRRRLVRQKTWRPATAPWALDSGGFSELSLFGRWTVEPEQYAGEVVAWQAQIGRLQWAAIQDWMCEPVILSQTGLTVFEHQRRSVQSYLDLSRIAPGVPWAPVVQGWTVADYLRCVELYRSAGVELSRLPVVGVGSVCRRQHSDEAVEIFRALHGQGLRLHGFGLKIKGLEKAAHYLVSADSLAWSLAGRREKIQGHPHKTCANCYQFAMEWRAKVLKIEGVE